MAFQKLRKSVRMWLEAVILISTEGDSQDSVFTHHELAVGEFFLKSLEVVGGHVIEREDIQILVLGHVCMNLIDDELLVLSLFRFGLGQGDELILFCLRHQQSLNF